jgi:hypothetical protein
VLLSACAVSPFLQNIPFLFSFSSSIFDWPSLLRRNLVPSSAVSLAGLAVPFGIGCAVSIGLFNEFAQPGVKFTTFMVFLGTSSCITALPVLARILGELGMMNDKVGLVALASGVVKCVVSSFLFSLRYSSSLSTATSSAGSCSPSPSPSLVRESKLPWFTFCWLWQDGAFVHVPDPSILLNHALHS